MKKIRFISMLILASLGFAACTDKFDENNDTYFENFYVKTLNDLEKSIRVGKTKTDFGNKLAIMQTWKAWEYFILVSTFGGVPMSDAQFVNGIDKNSDAGYMYRRVMIDIESGNQTWSSYTYPGMSHNFYIYMKSYDDPRLTVFLNTPDMKFWHLLRDDTITAPSAKWNSKGYRDSLIVQYVIPYKPRTAGKSTPAGYTVGTYTNPRNGRVESYRDPYAPSPSVAVATATSALSS